MLAAVGIWLSKKVAGMSIKAGLIGIVVLMVLSIFGTAGWYVNHLSDELAATSAQLATKTREAAEAKARADDIEAQHIAQIERMNTLEAQRSAIAVEVTTLRKAMQDKDLKEDLEGDKDDKANAAVARLNTRNTRLNGMLSRASGKPAVRPVKAPGSQAGTPDARAAFQRAIQALRKDGVPQSR